MKVYLLNAVQGIGKKSDLVVVSDGYARNYLFPHKLAIEVNASNEQEILNKKKVELMQKEVENKKTSVLYNKLNGLKIVFKEKSHDDGKLYGSVGETEIVEVLKNQGFSLSKNQILLDKHLKKIGTYPVEIHLSTLLKPTITIKIVSE